MEFEGPNFLFRDECSSAVGGAGKIVPIGGLFLIFSVLIEILCSHRNENRAEHF